MSKQRMTAQHKSTITHMHENAVSLQIEFGIRAGLPRFSWKLIQGTKALARTQETTSRVIVTGSRMLDKELEMILCYVSMVSDRAQDSGLVV